MRPHSIRALACAALITLAGPAFGQEAASRTTPAPEPAMQGPDPRTVGPDERTLGAADAPITLVEYASLTCPHCAHFHNDILPVLKERYIETGKVRYVYRDFPLDRLALAVGVLARCIDSKEESLAAVSAIFASQDQWMTAEQPLRAAAKVMEPHGLTPEKAEQCLSREDAPTPILLGAKAGNDAFEITGTPSFAINGEAAPNVHSIADFEKAFDERLGAN